MNFIKGIRLALGLVLGFPFIIFLLPFFLMYVFIEYRAGRPLPFDFKIQLNKIFETGSPEFHIDDSPPRAKTSLLYKPGTPRPEFLSDTQNDIRFKESIGQGIALVTDGTSPLGMEICRELSCLGYRVGVAWQSEWQKAEDVVTAILGNGGQACSLALDLTDFEKINQFVATAKITLGGNPSLLINNVAQRLPTSIHDPTWQTLNAIIQNNLQGPLWLTLKLAADMPQGSGHVIHVTDLYAERPLKGHCAYSVAGAGLIMATKSLAADLGPGIRINAISPGILVSFDNDPNQDTEKSSPPYHGPSPPQTMAVLQALRYLLSSHLVTGEVLHVDGGRRMLKV